jgi:non-canonical poly(A) RNA polymerase PAPD5/7
VPEHASVEMIFGAKVPLIKFVDRITGLKVDLSFENDTGIIANGTFANWKAQFPAMPIIVTLIKQFLMMRGLNEVVNGGLGGFSVTCLVTSLLQNMPEVQRGALIPEQHLGFILMEFFNLYGNEFNTTTTGIRLNLRVTLTRYAALSSRFTVPKLML